MALINKTKNKFGRNATAPDLANRSSERPYHEGKGRFFIDLPDRILRDVALEHLIPQRVGNKFNLR